MENSDTDSKKGLLPKEKLDDKARELDMIP